MEQRRAFLIVALMVITLACNALTKPITDARPTLPVQPTNLDTESQAPSTNSGQPDSVVPITVTPEESSLGVIDTPRNAIRNSWCNNVYFPIREGGSWVYTVTMDPPVNNIASMAMTISDILGDSVEVITTYYAFSSLTVDFPSGLPTEFLCLPDGLASPLSGPGGIFLPFEMEEAGSTWKEAIGTDSETTYTSLGVEIVTVPEGTFEAVKVKAVSSSMPGVTTFRWYVAGLGLVKTYVEGVDGWRTEVLEVYMPPLAP